MQRHPVYLLASCLLVACGSSDTTSMLLDTGSADADADSDPGAIDDGGGDAENEIAPVDAVDPDDASDGDGGDADTPPLAGERGAPCAADDECSPFVCYAPVPGDARGICVAPCVDGEQCLATELCQLVSSAGGDTQRVCVPEGLCLDSDGDGFGFGGGCRGPDCDDADLGVYLGANEVCDGVDNDCDGEIDESIAGLGGDCSTGFDGECAAGRLACADGTEQCEALRAPSEERCDGLDNNCNGAVDEAPDGSGPLSRACYAGSAATRDVGVCRSGAEVCTDGAFATCSDQVLPGVEVCDGLDNDCDGTVDNGNPGGGLSCPSGRPGECAAGVTTCVAGALVCEPVSSGRDEVCDGVDNDCDGQIDEDAANEGPLRRACYDGPAGTRDVGLCRAGVQLCDGAAYGSCDEQVLPIPEACDGLDNNCNGASDEGNPGGGLVCGTGLEGECAAGVTACVDGAIVCTETTTGRPETCDGVDNNCDGVIDDGNPGGGGACSTGRFGVCSAGVLACEGGALGCTQLTGESEEVCDGRDNDCDAAVDEGNPGGGMACSTGRPGVCGPGVLACTGGALVCNGSVAAASEVCDGLDNDCDAAVDDGCPSALSLSAGVSSPQYGGGGGTAFSYSCPAGSAVVGLFGRSGGEVDAIGARCAPVTLAENRAVTPYRYTMTTGAVSNGPSYGGSGGTAFSGACPANQVVIGVNVRADARLDRVQWVCGSLTVTGNPGALSVQRSQDGVSAMYGGSGGNPESYLCPSNQIVTGVFGRSGGRVDAFGVRCGAPGVSLR